MAQQTDTEADRTDFETGTAWEDPANGRTYRLARSNGLEVILEAEHARNDIRVVDAREFPGRYVQE